MILPVLAGLELLWAAFNQALVHVLPLGQDLKQRVVPFQDVDIQQMPRGEGTVAEGAGVSMHHVVVVLVVFYGGKHLATASHLTGELRHPIFQLSMDFSGVSDTCVSMSCKYRCRCTSPSSKNS